MESQLERAARVACDRYNNMPGLFDRAPEDFKDRWRAVAGSLLAFYRRRDQIELVQIGMGRGRGRPSRDPWATMVIGETFLIPRGADGKNKFNSTYVRKRYWENKFPGKKFSVKAVDDGLEVRRID